MQVKKIMSKNVVTVPIEASLDEAMALMKQYEIRHLPVVEGKKLIGLVTDRDIRSAIFPAMIEDINVKDLMVNEPITVHPDTMLEDAALAAYYNKIGCLPVIDKAGNLKGIVTVADMLASLIELMGFLSASSRLDIVLPDRPDALEQACHIIHEKGGRIIGISMTRLREDQPLHLFRLEKTKLDSIVKGLKKADFEVVSKL